MDLIKDVIKIDNRVDFGKFQTFIEAELVVPDKKMDVNEIVKTEGYISLKKIDISEGKISCKGSFNYNVIYMSNNKENLSNIEGKIDLNEIIDKDIATKDMECMMYGEVEHVDCTIINERKIRVGSLINIKGSLFEKQKIDIVKDVSQVEGVQKDKKEIVYQDIIGISKADSVIRDTVNINVEELECIISLNPEVKIKESRITDNKVIIGGVLQINPIGCTYDCELVELDKVGVDFTQFIEVPGASDGMDEEALLYINEFSYTFSKSEDSNVGILEIEATVECRVKVTDEVTREVLQDAYSPQKMLKFDYKTMPVNKMISHDKDTFIVRETLRSDDDNIQIKNVVSVKPSISIENSYVEDGKSIVQGIIKIDALFVPVEGLKMVYTISEEIPFEHDVTIEDLDENSIVFNTVCIDKIDTYLNRDQIDVTIKVSRYTEAVNKKDESFIVKGEDLGDYDLSKAPSIIVYICKEGDTLWNVAKKYNTTETEIAEINDLKLDETLQVGKCLILEKKVSIMN